MKWNTKKTTWVFLYIKYSKFWSVSLEHFIERKPLISEEWDKKAILNFFFQPCHLKKELEFSERPTAVMWICQLPIPQICQHLDRLPRCMKHLASLKVSKISPKSAIFSKENYMYLHNSLNFIKKTTYMWAV